MTKATSPAKQMLLSDKIDAITFTSPSTVSSLLAILEDKRGAINSAKIACIGPKTADRAASAGLKVDVVAGKHTIPGLVTAIEEYFT